MTQVERPTHKPSVHGGVFLKGIENPKYALIEMLEEQKKQPRVIKAKQLPWRGGPGAYNKNLITPNGPSTITQTLHIHYHAFAPGSISERHGHQNEAMLIVLEGKGYDIHDGEKIPWEAGDVAVVPNDCVHRHVNPDPEKPALVLICKTKELFMLMNLLGQYEVEPKVNPPEMKKFNPQEAGW